jgi:hypothetical protein
LFSFFSFREWNHKKREQNFTRAFFVILVCYSGSKFNVLSRFFFSYSQCCVYFFVCYVEFTFYITSYSLFLFVCMSDCCLLACLPSYTHTYIMFLTLSFAVFGISDFMKKCAFFFASHSLSFLLHPLSQWPLNETQ